MTDKSVEEIIEEIEGEEPPLPSEPLIPTKKKKNDDDDNIFRTSYFETDKYILEQINNANPAYSATLKKERKYIKYDKVSGSTELVDNFTCENRLVSPIVGGLVEQNIVLLPSDVKEYDSTKKLVKEMYGFLNEYFEVPKFFENFLPYLVLFYWVYERFPFVPYIHFLGKTGTGKTTAMEVLGSICYKPIDASGAITTASIFRVTSQWKGTLLLDEFSPKGDSYKDMLSLLKSGVSNKAVLRVEGEKKKEVAAYLVKSPKLFTSERPVTDAGLRSRVVEIIMNQNKRKVPLYRQDRFLAEAEQIRNKLLLWRFRNLNEIDLSKIEYGYKELNAFQGRVQQVITPIYYVADDKAKKEILKFAEEQQAETLRERRESVEGQLFEIVYDNYRKELNPSLSEIAEKLNKGTKYPMSDRKIASILRKVLDFNVRKMGHENITSIDLADSETNIKELCEYFGIEYMTEIEEVFTSSSKKHVSQSTLSTQHGKT